jgi:DNA mismatch repair protein MutS
VVFLHEVLPGSARIAPTAFRVAKSQDFQLPLSPARSQCWQNSEAQDRNTTTRALIDDLRSLRFPRAAPEPQPPSETDQVLEALNALHPDEMSPREALDALYALKAKLPSNAIRPD